MAILNDYEIDTVTRLVYRQEADPKLASRLELIVKLLEHMKDEFNVEEELLSDNIYGLMELLKLEWHRIGTIVLFQHDLDV